jgi:pimeloyl-ACP methyl ester carboxylesterase
LQRYRQAQLDRLMRLEAWCKSRLRQIRSVRPGGDLAFVVHRTLADPRCLDASIDRNDRPPGTTVWGAPIEQNFAANSMGRYTSLTAFLSQWALCSVGDGPARLRETSVPVALAQHSADSSTFPSDHKEWVNAANGRIRERVLKGGNHYLQGQPQLVAELSDFISEFAKKL